MQFLDKIVNFIFKLQPSDFKKIILLILTVSFALMFLIGFNLFRQKSSYLTELKKTYALRDEASTLIDKNNLIKKQKDIVNTMLEETSTFKLIQFFDNTTDALRLNQYVERKNISIVDLENKDYSKIILDSKINNLNMKQLADLLSKIDENERVLIEKLEINKSNKLPSVDVELTISTLQPKSE